MFIKKQQPFYRVRRVGGYPEGLPVGLPVGNMSHMAPIHLSPHQDEVPASAPNCEHMSIHAAVRKICSEPESSLAEAISHDFCRRQEDVTDELRHRMENALGQLKDICQYKRAGFKNEIGQPITLEALAQSAYHHYFHEKECSRKFEKRRKYINQFVTQSIDELNLLFQRQYQALNTEHKKTINHQMEKQYLNAIHAHHSNEIAIKRMLMTGLSLLCKHNQKLD